MAKKYGEKTKKDKGRQKKFSKERMEKWESMARVSRRNKQEGGE